MTGEEKRIRRSHRWRRRITLGIAIVTGLLLTAAVFVAFWKVERRRAREEFLNLAHQRQDAAYHALMERLFVLQAVRSMYMASTFVERSEFATFTNLYINRVPGVEGLWWVPRIPASGRDECERLARRDGIEAFAVFEHDAKGRPIPASPREIYYPVLYAQPQREYRQFLGFDAGTLPSFRDVMRRARDENRTLVVQNESNSGLPPLSDAVVFVTPVYQKGAEILTVAERREHFLGLVMGGFRLSEILLGETTAYDTPPPPAAAQTVQVQLWDEPADAPFRPNGCDVDATKQNMWGFTFEPVWCSHRVYNVGGRRWVIRCTSVWHSVASTILPGGWGILSGGVALTALLTAYLYGLLYRAERVQNLVEKRTAELKTEIFARKQAEGSLLESLSFRDKLLEISLTGVFTVDSQRRITSVNRALLDMTGYTRDDLLGQSCSVLSCFGCGGHCNLFDTEQQHPIHNVECVIRSKEGRRIILRKNADWIRDRDGVVVGGVECLVDVTDLYKAKQDAETAVEAKREFLMRMSHEVRTPMNCVLGMTELALQTDLTEDQKRYLTLSRSSAETLSRMVGDILDYSNLEAGALELECVAFDLPDCLDETLLALKFTAQAKGLELISDVSPDVPDRLRGDPVRIRQILTNLVGNAVKFTEGGRVVVTVRQQFRDGDDVRLLFCVRDTGIGISRENQSRIFDVFEQANAATAQKHGGVGLGLSLSLQLVHLMGGKVWLESEVGEGSAFSFTLPLRVSSDAPDILTSSPKDLAGVPVLVVDDNQTNRFLLEKILSHWEMRPTLTSGGAAALEALRDAWEKGNPFALVLLDVNMPEMDGFETARRIREDNRLAETTILMLSSVGQREHAERCRTLGISAYVTKPIRQAVLLHSILEVLNITPPVQKTTLPGGMYPDQSFHERLDLRVLLAEDDHVNQILAQNALEDLGCRITLVGNGREAIAVWENDSHDLILMDVQMPLMDGLEAARAIRDREQRRAANEHVPIIAMTAHALKGDRELCLQAGMDAYIAKPVQSDELLRVIQSTLQKLHAHAETNPGNNENREE